MSGRVVGLKIGFEPQTETWLPGMLSGFQRPTLARTRSRSRTWTCA